MLSVTIYVLASLLSCNGQDNQGVRNVSPFTIVSGDDFLIFRPVHSIVGKHHLIAPPEQWLNSLKNTFAYLDSYVDTDVTVLQRAQKGYLDMLKGTLTRLTFLPSGKSVVDVLRNNKYVDREINESQCTYGHDLLQLGDMTTSIARLKSIEQFLEIVIKDHVDGGFMETGAWRSVLSIFAKGVIRIHSQSRRMVYVCDSFRGLPQGNPALHRGDVGWDEVAYLGVSAHTAAKSFAEMSLLDDQVIFARGFLNATMKPLRGVVESLAVLHMGGDLYGSTIDVLYNMYDKVSIGGYVVVDNWFGFPAQDACVEFFKIHGIAPQIIKIDQCAVYWRKDQEVVINYNNYLKLKSDNIDIHM